MHQLLLSIHMEPLTVTATGLNGFRNQATPDTSPLKVRMYCGIEQEEMRIAVPSHVDEADEFVSADGSHPCEAVREHAMVARFGKSPSCSKKSI